MILVEFGDDRFLGQILEQNTLFGGIVCCSTVEALDREAILASLSHHVQHKIERLGDTLRLSLRATDGVMLSDLLLDHDALEEGNEELDGEIEHGLMP